MKGIDRAVKAVKFVHDNKFWTITDLRNHLGVGKNSAYKIRDALSMHYPVRVARRLNNGGGTRPDLFTICGNDE